MKGVSWLFIIGDVDGKGGRVDGGIKRSRIRLRKV